MAGEGVHNFRERNNHSSNLWASRLESFFWIIWCRMFSNRLFLFIACH